MSSSSKRWLQRHFKDKYVKQAQQEGYPSRAAYKLLEIQQKDHLIKPGMTIIDLGAAPGGWSMVASNLLKKCGKIIALDILPMEITEGTTFLQGDFTDQLVLNQLLAIIGEAKVDLVMSDMAPNLSGQRVVDQPRAMYLVELALDFAVRILSPGGAFLVKVFQGEGADVFIKNMRMQFKQVKIRKPEASRNASREVYILGKDFIGYNNSFNQEARLFE